MLSFGVSVMLYLFFSVAQVQFKIEAHNEIAASQHLQTIKLSLSEFNNARGKDELWLNGRLYDVHSYVVVNDSVFVSVFHDEDEESIVKIIADSFEPNDKSINDGTVHLSRCRVHLPSDGKALPERYFVRFVPGLVTSRSSSVVQEHFIHLSFSVIKPPPKVAS